MCGIAILAAPGGMTIPDDVIVRMTRSLQHRGPDAQSWICEEGCQLGHTRLSVIDLIGGHQPMVDTTGRYTLVFNGEIYNYRELRKELMDAGRRFRTTSDTEVLLYAYLEYGATVVSRLNGQFAFAIWDREARRLFAARDRLGEKPFYWAVTPEGLFLAASELKAILASGLLHPQLNPAALSMYLALFYVPADRSIYRNVSVLKPGSCLTWEDGHIREWTYWRPRFSQRVKMDRGAAVEEIRRRMKKGVERQMVADVPLGAFLSGGLDSSTIVSYMAQLSAQPVLTFSAGFGELIDERPYARAVATACRTKHYEINVDVAVGELLERMAVVYDEPFADSSNIPTFLISEFARKHVKVVLSGDGGDELFGGYEWYRVLLARLQAEAQAPMWRRMGRRARAWLRRLQGHSTPGWWDFHVTQAGLWETMPGQPDCGRSLGATRDELRAAYRSPDLLKGMDIAVDFDLRCYLPGDILVKVDRAAMAHGLETRVPFLDVDLVEFVLALPWEWRFSGQVLKGLLREACGDLWPPALQGRGKQGFGAPLENWIIRPDVQALWERVCKSGRVLEAILPGIACDPRSMPAQQAWTLLCLGLWLEAHPCSLEGWDRPA